MDVQTRRGAIMTNKTQIAELRAAALACSDLDLNTAQIVRDNSDGEHECPLCEGAGMVDGDIDYCNIDGVALGVQFYGIGSEHGLAEKYFRAANPKTVISFLDQLEAAEARIAELEGVAARQKDTLVKYREDVSEAEAELAELRGASVPVALVEDSDYLTIEEMLGNVPRRKAVKELYECALIVGQRLFTHPAPPVVVLPMRAEHAEWSQATVGNVGPVGPLKHLSKEAIEASEAPDDLSEWADMQFLFWDAQRRAGITDAQIEQAMIEKLAINKARAWPEPKEGEPRLHLCKLIDTRKEHKLK